jgi:hypothetical protein
MLYLGIIKKYKHMRQKTQIKTFLIFTNPSNIYDYVVIKCFKDDLNNQLINEELLSPDDHYSDFDWVIFEDGDIIKG